MTVRIPIVVLASGRGTGFESIYRAIEKNELQAEIKAVISDQPEALVLTKARAVGIKALSLPFPKATAGRSVSERRHEHEGQVLEVLNELKPKFLVLAGYMRIFTSYLIETFRCDHGYVRMVNVHPSLLPSFPGVNSYAQAYRYGAKISGVTVHLVETQVDTGPICAQEAFSIADCRSELEVEQRGLAVEHRLFPKTLNWVLSENFSVENRLEGRLCVCPN